MEIFSFDMSSFNDQRLFCINMVNSTFWFFGLKLKRFVLIVQKGTISIYRKLLSASNNLIRRFRFPAFDTKM